MPAVSGVQITRVYVYTCAVAVDSGVALLAKICNANFIREVV